MPPENHFTLAQAWAGINFGLRLEAALVSLLACAGGKCSLFAPGTVRFAAELMAELVASLSRHFWADLSANVGHGQRRGSCNKPDAPAHWLSRCLIRKRRLARKVAQWGAAPAAFELRAREGHGEPATRNPARHLPGGDAYASSATTTSKVDRPFLRHARRSHTMSGAGRAARRRQAPSIHLLFGC